MKETAEQFLLRHGMHPSAMSTEDLICLYRQDMDAALSGRSSGVLMLPSFIRSDARPVPEEQVLVIDAGGSNLRVGIAHFDKQGRAVTDALKKRRMPGADGRIIDADTLFEEIAAFALEYASRCRRACISFSYACDTLPDRDGRVLHLCKELTVTGAEGRMVCASIESALQRLGAEGTRRWTLINDSVGSMLGGMAAAPRGVYSDFIGFILGTGTNTCCGVPAEKIIKSPEAVSMGGDIIVNVESGCFAGIKRGDADLELDAESSAPGSHPAEKMVSGGYLPVLLRQVLLLAAKEGVIAAESGENIRAMTVRSKHIDHFLARDTEENPLQDALVSEEDRLFAREAVILLLQRAARVAAACLLTLIILRDPAPGSRICVCADGTMLKLNPILLPAIREEIRPYGEARGFSVDFLFAEDTSLMGAAWAGLL